jgi:hypothetical protein
MPSRWITFFSVVLLVVAGSVSHAQAPRTAPKLQTVFPSGGQAGKSVEITIAGADLDASDALWFSHPGIVATPVKGKPKTFSVTMAVDVPAGQYDVRGLTSEGISNPRTFVVGLLPEANEVEPNNDFATAKPIAINSVVNGVSLPVDVDCFRFEAKKGRRLFFKVVAQPIESKFDGTLRLLDDRGYEIAESRDFDGLDPFLDFTIPRDGSYVIKLHDGTYAGSPEHFYRLIIFDGPVIDAVIPAIAIAGKPTEFTLIGRNLRGSRLADKSSDGQVLETKTITISPNFVSPGELPLSFTGVATGLRGEALDLRTEAGVASPFVVTEAIDPVVLEREPNTIESPQVVMPPCAISGDFRIAGDIDVYRFKAKKGEVWKIEAVSQGIGSQADPTFTLQSVPDKGEPVDINTSDDQADAGLSPRLTLISGDPSYRWTAPNDGTYQVVLNDIAGNNRGDVRLFYRLSIVRERPRFKLYVVPTTPNVLDAVTIRRAGRSSAIVLAWRLDGFTQSINVKADHLPAGIKCDPVIIPQGQNQAVVVFEAAADAKPIVGTIELSGTAVIENAQSLSGGFLPACAMSLGQVVKAIPISAINPPLAVANARRPPSSEVRTTHGFVVAIRDGSPFLLDAKPRRSVIAIGQPIELALTLKRNPGTDDAIALTAPDAPKGFTLAAASIPKGANALNVTIPTSNVAAGDYTFVLRGGGLFKPDAKKPAVKVDEPSNVVRVTLRPSPIEFNTAAIPPAVKAGETLVLDCKITRKADFKGAVKIVLEAPGVSKISASPLTIPAGQAVGKLSIVVAKDAPLGVVAATLRAEVMVGGQSLDVSLPLSFKVSKP